MPLTYEESAALMKDGDFQGRIKVAALKYADSLIGGASGGSKARWAQQTFTQPDFIAAQLQPPVVMDAAVQTAGGGIDDAGLQGAVETVVNKIL